MIAYNGENNNLIELGGKTVSMYGVCNTAAELNRKEVGISNLSSLKPGTTIRVKFANENTNPNPLLVINDTMVNPIYSYGTTVGDSWSAGSVVQLTYDGASWLIGSSSGSGGGTTYEAGSGISIANDTISNTAMQAGLNITDEFVGEAEDPAHQENLGTFHVQNFDNKIYYDRMVLHFLDDRSTTVVYYVDGVYLNSSGVETTSRYYIGFEDVSGGLRGNINKGACIALKFDHVHHKATLTDFLVKGTDVTGNPDEVATESLTKIRIEDTVYSIDAGSSGDDGAEMYVGQGSNNGQDQILLTDIDAKREIHEGDRILVYVKNTIPVATSLTVYINGEPFTTTIDSGQVVVPDPGYTAWCLFEYRTLSGAPDWNMIFRNQGDIIPGDGLEFSGNNLVNTAMQGGYNISDATVSSAQYGNMGDIAVQNSSNKVKYDYLFLHIQTNQTITAPDNYYFQGLYYDGSMSEQFTLKTISGSIYRNDLVADTMMIVKLTHTYNNHIATVMAVVGESGGGGGTTVVANPSGTASTDLTKLQVENTIYGIPVGTTVVANPSTTGSTTLTKLKVDTTTYNVPQGTNVVANPSGSGSTALTKLQVGSSIYTVGLPQTPLSVANGGTGNTTGYVRAGQKSGTTVGTRSTMEGYNTTANSSYAHAEGNATRASGQSSHAEGNGSVTETASAHAEGDSTTASGTASHTEGSGTKATVYAAHAEGYNTTASGSAAHAEGYTTTAEGLNSHAEGEGTKASSEAAHAEGANTTASGSYSHAEGGNTKSSGNNSHAEGASTTASGSYSHAEGRSTVAGATSSHAGGQYVGVDSTCTNTFVNGLGKSSSSITTVTGNKSGFTILDASVSKFASATGLSSHGESTVFSLSTNLQNPGTIDAKYGACVQMYNGSTVTSTSFLLDIQAIYFLNCVAYKSDNTFSGGCSYTIAGACTSSGTPSSIVLGNGGTGVSVTTASSNTITVSRTQTTHNVLIQLIRLA